MSTAAVTPEKSDAQVQDEAKAQKNLMDPYEYLATFPNAPSKAIVESYKQQAPNGVIRIFAIGKRVYLVRGISGLELQQVQSEIPSNLGAGLEPEARAAKVENELSIRVAARCTCWTSSSGDGKLTLEQLKSGSAGLPSTLFNLISYLSDFVDPEALQLMSAEL
jgi:hypothetical protein